MVKIFHVPTVIQLTIRLGILTGKFWWPWEGCTLETGLWHWIIWTCYGKL